MRSTTHPSLVLAIGLIVGLAGCTLLSDDFDGITIVNETGELLYTRGVERELADRLYVSYTIPTAKLPFTEGILLQPGASVTLPPEEVMGDYSTDKTLRLFLYQVRGDTAYRTSLRDVTPSELEKKNFRIELSAFPKD